MSEGFTIGSTATTFTSGANNTFRSMLNDRINELKDERAALESYALTKHRAKDWHAVQDAGSDIRELDARLDELGRL